MNNLTFTEILTSLYDGNKSKAKQVIAESNNTITIEEEWDRAKNISIAIHNRKWYNN